MSLCVPLSYIEDWCEMFTEAVGDSYSLLKISLSLCPSLSCQSRNLNLEVYFLTSSQRQAFRQMVASSLTKGI